MPEFSPETDRFIAELDAAVEAHMDWTRRILRCAVLHASPGDDVLAPHAHTLCHFGGWFNSNRSHFQALDADTAARIERVHQAMHDAMRTICDDVLARRAGRLEPLQAFEQSQSELLGLLARFKTLILANAVRHDPLTGLPLRYGVESDYELSQKDAARHGSRLYVVMIDADHFKSINDTHGHAVGDVVLRHLADVLRRTLRGNEPLYRFGGEEFLLLTQCRSADEAALLAERIVATVRATPAPLPGGKSLALTVTLGVAEVAAEEELASALARADAALYAGKQAGRDRWVAA
jgi:diguanylate cyclase (GGDEF)-like protein